ncbi:hypothetical protein DVS28_b0284 (plasmid) [Euzebya pacifica]|uniref:Uncharacterized protein n=1 Tax=Euzebya pacifica TaxID=1608957 RepID=A0A346Y6F7_9ACTN|nr:hypothetical protein [Euzebya pacifica]AXV10054.1 hypothetical protein DVS28_b0284 [Euzebya pacifica]
MQFSLSWVAALVVAVSLLAGCTATDPDEQTIAATDVVTEPSGDPPVEACVETVLSDIAVLLSGGDASWTETAFIYGDDARTVVLMGLMEAVDVHVAQGRAAALALAQDVVTPECQAVVAGLPSPSTWWTIAGDHDQACADEVIELVHDDLRTGQLDGAAVIRDVAGSQAGQDYTTARLAASAIRADFGLHAAIWSEPVVRFVVAMCGGTVFPPTGTDAAAPPPAPVPATVPDPPPVPPAPADIDGMGSAGDGRYVHVGLGCGDMTGELVLEDGTGVLPDGGTATVADVVTGDVDGVEGPAEVVVVTCNPGGNVEFDVVLVYDAHGVQVGGTIAGPLVGVVDGAVITASVVHADSDPVCCPSLTEDVPWVLHGNEWVRQGP